MRPGQVTNNSAPTNNGVAINNVSGAWDFVRRRGEALMGVGRGGAQKAAPPRPSYVQFLPPAAEDEPIDVGMLIRGGGAPKRPSSSTQSHHQQRRSRTPPPPLPASRPPTGRAGRGTAPSARDGEADAKRDRENCPPSEGRNDAEGQFAEEEAAQVLGRRPTRPISNASAHSSYAAPTASSAAHSTSNLQQTSNRYPQQQQPQRQPLGPRNTNNNASRRPSAVVAVAVGNHQPMLTPLNEDYHRQPDEVHVAIARTTAPTKNNVSTRRTAAPAAIEEISAAVAEEEDAEEGDWGAGERRASLRAEQRRRKPQVPPKSSGGSYYYYSAIAEEEKRDGAFQAMPPSKSASEVASAVSEALRSSFWHRPALLGPICDLRAAEAFLLRKDLNAELAHPSATRASSLELSIVFDARCNRFEDHIVAEMRRCVFESLLSFVSQRAAVAGMNTHHNSSSSAPDVYGLSMSLHTIMGGSLLQQFPMTAIVPSDEGDVGSAADASSPTCTAANLRSSLEHVRQCLRKQLNIGQAPAKGRLSSSKQKQQQQQHSADRGSCGGDGVPANATPQSHTVLPAAADPTRLHVAAIEHIVASHASTASTTSPNGTRRIILLFSCCGRQCGIPSAHLQQRASAMLLSHLRGDPSSRPYSSHRSGTTASLRASGGLSASAVVGGQASLALPETHIICYSSGGSGGTSSSPSDGRSGMGGFGHTAPSSSFSSSVSASFAPTATPITPFVTVHRRPAAAGASTSSGGNGTAVSLFFGALHTPYPYQSASALSPASAATLRFPTSSHAPLSVSGSRSTQQKRHNKLRNSPSPADLAAALSTALATPNGALLATSGSSNTPQIGVSSFPSFVSGGPSGGGNGSNNTIRASIAETFAALHRELVGDYVTPVVLRWAPDDEEEPTGGEVEGVKNDNGEGDGNGDSNRSLQRRQSGRHIVRQAASDSDGEDASFPSLTNRGGAAVIVASDGYHCDAEDDCETNPMPSPLADITDTAVVCCTVHPFPRGEGRQSFINSLLFATPERPPPSDSRIFNSGRPFVDIRIVGAADCAAIDEERLFGTAWSVHLPPPLPATPPQAVGTFGFGGTSTFSSSAQPPAALPPLFASLLLAQSAGGESSDDPRPLFSSSSSPSPQMTPYDRVLLCTSSDPSVVAHYYGPAAGYPHIHSRTNGERSVGGCVAVVAMVAMLSGDGSRLVFRGFASGEAARRVFDSRQVASSIKTIFDVSSSMPFAQPLTGSERTIADFFSSLLV